MRAAGSILHDFYCGVEKIFERIAVVVDKNLPKGDNWHVDLLAQMSKPQMNTRVRIWKNHLCTRQYLGAFLYAAYSQ